MVLPLFTDSPSPFLVLLRKLKSVFLSIYFPSCQHIPLPFIKTTLPFSATATAVFITEVLQGLRIFRVEILVIYGPKLDFIYQLTVYAGYTHTCIYINTHLHYSGKISLPQNCQHEKPLFCQFPIFLIQGDDSIFVWGFLI